MFMSLRERFFHTFAAHFRSVEQIAAIVENESDKAVQRALGNCLQVFFLFEFLNVNFFLMLHILFHWLCFVKFTITSKFFNSYFLIIIFSLNILNFCFSFVLPIFISFYQFKILFFLRRWSRAVWPSSMSPPCEIYIYLNKPMTTNKSLKILFTYFKFNNLCIVRG